MKEPDFFEGKLREAMDRFQQQKTATTEEEKERLLDAFNTAVLTNVRGQVTLTTQFDPLCYEFMGDQIRRFLKQKRASPFEAFLLGVGIGALWRHLMEQRKEKR